MKVYFALEPNPKRELGGLRGCHAGDIDHPQTTGKRPINKKSTGVYVLPLALHRCRLYTLGIIFKGYRCRFIPLWSAFSGIAGVVYTPLLLKPPPYNRQGSFMYELNSEA